MTLEHPSGVNPKCSGSVREDSESTSTAELIQPAAQVIHGSSQVHNRELSGLRDTPL